MLGIKDVFNLAKSKNPEKPVIEGSASDVAIYNGFITRLIDGLLLKERIFLIKMLQVKSPTSVQNNNFMSNIKYGHWII